jgi:uncharacterized ferredoxin-like protein
MSEHIGYETLRLDAVLQAARAMAGAAITAPKSGGMLFIKGSPNFMETVIIHERETLRQLAEWMRARGKERRETIWFRDAAVADRIDAVLLVGLSGWYPPNYDCGACGFATCAEFLNATRKLREQSKELEFGGPQCNLRDIDLGIAVGSAAKTAALLSVDCRCQTRIAVAARKLGIITSDIAVGLSLSLTHKSIGFDRPFPEVDFDALDLPTTGTLPIAAGGGARHGGARHRQQSRTPAQSASDAPP